MIMYREGEPLHELSTFLEGEGDGPQSVEVRIPVQYLTSQNRQVRSRQLWGSDTYTSDSDLVAVLMHYGYIHHTVTQPVRDVAEVRVVVKPLPAQPSYSSTARNSIRSRAWSSATNGCAYAVEKAWIVTRTGNTYDLSPTSTGPPASAATFAPSHLERMVTRSAAGPAARQRHVQEVTVIFNLVNEPWTKYTPTAICDRGLKPHDWTSSRLHTHVLYLESHTTRYEVSRSNGPNDNGSDQEVFKFAKCMKALTARASRAAGVPLPAEHVTVEFEGLQWEELQWGKDSVVIKDKKYELSRIYMMPLEAEHEDAADGIMSPVREAAEN